MSRLHQDRDAVQVWTRFEACLAERRADPTVALPIFAPVKTIPSGRGPALRTRRARGRSAAVQGALGGLVALGLVATSLGATAVFGEGGGGAQTRLLAPIAPAGGYVSLSPLIDPAGLSAPRSGRAPAASSFEAAFMGPPSRLAALTEETALMGALGPAPRPETGARQRAVSRAETPTRVVIRAAPTADPSPTVDRLRGQGFDHVRTRPAAFAAVSVQARYFHRQDRDRAVRILAALNSPAAPSDFTTLRPTPPRGYVEVWLPATYETAQR